MKDKNKYTPEAAAEVVHAEKIEINNITFDLSMRLNKVTNEKLDKLKTHNITVSHVDIVAEM